MKKRNFILLFALLFFSIDLFGQAKPISLKEYDALVKAAEAQAAQKIRRETAVNTEFKKGKATHVTTVTQDFLPPDRSRWLITESNGFKILSRTELIYIGDREYRKDNNGAWAVRELKPDKTADADESTGFPSLPENTTDEYFLEEIKAGREVVKVLTKKTVNAKKTNFTESKIWLGPDGLITKTTAETTLKPDNMILSDTVAYDYEIAKPLIEAPVNR